MDALVEWFKAERRELFSNSAIQMPNGLFMGCPVWGKQFVERFGTYCLASIVSKKNIEALKGRCRLVLYTSEEDDARLLHMLVPLAPWIDGSVRLIPRAVLDWEKEGEFNKYMILGAIQTLGAMAAGRAGMGYHMLQPDHVFEEAYFPNLFRLAQDHDAITQISVSVDIDKAKDDLEKYRTADDELAIPSRDLGDIGFRHLHQQMRMYLMNEAEIPDRMPHSHFLLWQAPDRLVIYSVHHNAAWLSPTICQRARFKGMGFIFGTMDTKLPQMLDGARVYMTEADDGMTFIEVSDESKKAAPAFVPTLDFAIACHRTTMFRDDHRSFFAERCTVPIAPRDTGASEDEITAQHGRVVDLLEEWKPKAALELLRAMYEGRTAFPVQTMVMKA